MPKIITDSANDSPRIRNIIWAVGAMHRSSMRTGATQEMDWSVEEPRWLVSAETVRHAIREIAKQHAFEIKRWSWDDRGQRCLYVMPWNHYHTESAPPRSEIDSITDVDTGVVVRFHRRWS